MKSWATIIGMVYLAVPSVVIWCLVRPETPWQRLATVAVGLGIMAGLVVAAQRRALIDAAVRSATQVLLSSQGGGGGQYN